MSGAFGCGVNEILGQFPRLPQTALSQRCRGTAAGLGWKRGRANDAVSFISLLHCIFSREREEKIMELLFYQSCILSVLETRPNPRMNCT